LAFCATTQKRYDEALAYAGQKLKHGTYKIFKRVKRSDLLPVLSQADVGIVDYPYSLEKTWNQKFCAPTKLYEYLAAGLAVVGSDNDSLRKVVENNKAGVCAKSDSVESLASAIDEVLSSEVTLRIMKGNAKHVFGEKYSYEKCCYPVVAQIAQFLQNNVEEKI
jgi:glycosyltransferase involved in cell wall biosynthesis